MKEVTLRPNQIAPIPDLRTFKKKVIARHGLRDEQVAEAVNTGWSQELYADAHKEDGLYVKFREAGYRWSHDVGVWFYMGKDMSPADAVVVQILLN